MPGIVYKVGEGRGNKPTNLVLLLICWTLDWFSNTSANKSNPESRWRCNPTACSKKKVSPCPPRKWMHKFNQNNSGNKNKGRDWWRSCGSRTYGLRTEGNANILAAGRMKSGSRQGRTWAINLIPKSSLKRFTGTLRWNLFKKGLWEPLYWLWEDASSHLRSNVLALKDQPPPQPLLFKISK